MTRKLHVKTGDNVQVISGKDLGKTGKVIAVDFENARVKVEGVNIQTKHKKANQAMQQGLPLNAQQWFRRRIRPRPQSFSPPGRQEDRPLYCEHDVSSSRTQAGQRRA